MDLRPSAPRTRGPARGETRLVARDARARPRRPPGRPPSPPPDSWPRKAPAAEPGGRLRLGDSTRAVVPICSTSAAFTEDGDASADSVTSVTSADSSPPSRPWRRDLPIGAGRRNACDVLAVESSEGVRRGQFPDLFVIHVAGCCSLRGCCAGVPVPAGPASSRSRAARPAKRRSPTASALRRTPSRSPAAERPGAGPVRDRRGCGLPSCRAGRLRSPPRAPRAHRRRLRTSCLFTRGPHPIDCSTPGPHQEPGFRAPATRVVLGRLAPHLPEHLLQDLLGGAGIVKAPAGSDRTRRRQAHRRSG